MAKCAACGKFISTKGGATCRNISCNNRYHLACLLLPESILVGNDWLCPECKKKLPKGDNSATPIKNISSEDIVAQISAPGTSISAGAGAPETVPRVRSSDAGRSTDGEPSPETQLTLREEIKLFRSELREVRDELRDFRREMVELNSSYGVCTQRIEGLEERVVILENRAMAAAPDEKIDRLERTVAKLQQDLNDREQDLLNSDLEISNLPEVPGENVTHTVVLVAAKLGMTLDQRDIVFAQRVGLRVEHEQAGAAMVNPVGGAGQAVARGRRIVVRLSRRALRDDLLQSARVRRGATSAELGFPGPPRRFFVNERLTKINKYLYYRAREYASRLGWRYTWTKFGRILAKQSDGKQTHWIRSEEDLDRVFGQVIPADRDD